MEGGNVERARRMIEAFNRGDVDMLQQLSTADVRIVPIRAALEDTDYSGPSAFRDFWEAIASEWSQLALDMDEFTEEGDRVSAAGCCAGRPVRPERPSRCR